MGSFIKTLSRVMNGLMANDGTGDSLRAGANDINSSWTAIEQAVNALAASQGSGVKPYATAAAMNADAQPDGVVAVVYADPTPANNTSYARQGGAWVMAYDRLTYALGNGSGFLQPDTGGVLWPFGTRDQGEVRFGDHTTLQQSIDAAYARGVPFVGKKGAVVILNTPLTLYTGLIADFRGMTVKPGAGITSGATVVMDGTSTPTNASGMVRDLTILQDLVSGHADTSKSIDGLSLGGSSGAVSSVGFYNLRIMGFRDNLRFDGPHCYLNHFYNPQIGIAWRRGVANYANTDSNENNSFFGGNIFNCNNTTFDGSGYYIDPAASSVDTHFFGTSFDYCDKSIVMYQSEVTLIGCHFENNNNNPHVTMSYTAGKVKPRLHVVGGQMGGGPGVTSWTGIAQESATGRPAMVETVAGGSYDVAFNAFVANKASSVDCTTEVVKVTAGALRRADIRPIFDAATGASTFIPPIVSRALNGFYKPASLTGWTQAGSSGSTLSYDGSDFKAPDNGSRKAVGTAGNSCSYYQSAGIKPGQTIAARAYAKADTLTSGYLALRVQFYAQDGTTVVQDIIGNQVTTTGSYQPVWVYAIAPAGAVSVRIIDYFNSWNGTGRFSDEVYAII